MPGGGGSGGLGRTFGTEDILISQEMGMRTAEVNHLCDEIYYLKRMKMDIEERISKLQEKHKEASQRREECLKTFTSSK